MKKATNERIRVVMATYGLKQWQVAKMIGVGETKYCRMLRDELPDYEQDRIVEVIKKSVEQ